MGSLSCWIIFTLPLGIIQPSAVSCIVKVNATTYLLQEPERSDHNINKRDVLEAMYRDDDPDIEEPRALPAMLLNPDDTFAPIDMHMQPTLIRRKRGAPPLSVAGKSPLDVSYASNYDENENKNWVSPPFSSGVFKISVSERR